MTTFDTFSCRKSVIFANINQRFYKLKNIRVCNARRSDVYFGEFFAEIFISLV